MSRSLLDNAEQITNRVAEACRRCGRSPSQVRVLAASKGQPAAKMKLYAEFCAAAGAVPLFGENYVQEFRAKKSELNFPYEIHMIGAMQRNKAKEAISLFDTVQSLHSVQLAAELNKYGEKAKKIQSVFVQINVSNDQAKSGFTCDEAREFIHAMLPRFTFLKLTGLMTITRDYEDPEAARPDYAKLRGLRESISTAGALKAGTAGLALSMGMSHDYEIAIEEGADIIRVGTALFGTR